jgi:hypothetical protein
VRKVARVRRWQAEHRETYNRYMRDYMRRKREAATRDVI